MKHLLNTLFVTTQGSYLAKDGECVVVSVEHEERLRVPVHNLGGLVCFGQVTLSPYLMNHCTEHGVGISMLSEQGRFLARVQGAVSGNVLLRREQYRRTDDSAASAALATSFVMAKAANARTVLRRAVRDHGSKPGMEQAEAAAARLGRILADLSNGHPLDIVRGMEGDAARTYFGAFDLLITAQKESFFFRERSRRPPLDNLNALLSFIYTLLVHDCQSALEGIGLDPQVGFLHRERPGRPSLALDLMEEFRPFFADRLALSLVNLRQIDERGFRTSESGAVEMTDDTRKTLLTAYQKRKQEEITHPFLGEAIRVGLLPHVQSLLLARHLRGDLDGYPPFVWK
jgi:CRISPR-associated protein Cas1